MSLKEKNATLSNGIVIPLVGMGTYSFKGKEASSLFKNAWEMGYRSFDTAWAYQNEVDLGKMLRESGIRRDEVFLTSKLHINNLYWPRFYYSFGGIRCKSVKQAYEGSCMRLGVDYLDLYLIHWPFPGFPRMWKELVQLYHESRVRAIGVCACLPKHLEYLYDYTGMSPHVNQIEMNPYNNRKDVVDFCHERGIVVEANSPLGGGVFTERLLSEPVLGVIARRHGVSTAQVILRWLIQQGIVVIPRSGDKNHLYQDLSLYGFSLFDSEICQIEGLNRGSFIRGDSRRVGLDGKFHKIVE